MENKKICIFPNDDKKIITDRIIIASPNNSGKTTLILNIILNSDFDNIYILHNSPYSDDYSMIDHVKIDNLMEFDLENLDKTQNNLLIIEDYDLYKSGKLYNKLIMLFRVSSHFALSIYITAQNPYYVKTDLRRLCNKWIIWPNKINKKTLKNIYEFCNINEEQAKVINEICDNDFDSIYIHLGRKNQIYKNLFQLIEF